MHYAVAQITSFPMDLKVLQRREYASRNAYKHNAFLMVSCYILQNRLQNPQYSSDFIRFWETGFPNAQNVVFSNVFLAFWRGLERGRSSLPGRTQAKKSKKLIQMKFFLIFTLKKRLA